MAEAGPHRGYRPARHAASFPGNLHLVMVLRPTGFFQRTFTDIGFRFSQEDFLLKLPVAVMGTRMVPAVLCVCTGDCDGHRGVPSSQPCPVCVQVVMLSSVSDLLTYIDEQQLTPELGGTLEYCHSEWVVFRTAIESFALTVKEIAQMLQCFGTELAETELPEDMNSIEHILALRTQRYCQLKVGLSTALGTASSSFEEPDSGECSEEQQQERPGDWETVNRLLGQLREMETAFDGFWEKHQLKMEQYLQLWKFEQSFQEVKNAIEFLMGQQAELPGTGDSIPQVKQRLKDLEHFDGLAQDLIGKAQVVILHGHQLAANHHYALNLICQQCNELRHHGDLLADDIKRKQASLQKTLELHTRLQQCQVQAVQVKLDNIRSLFQSRQSCFKKLLDKHVRPVQLVAPRPENPPRSKSPLFSPKHGVDFNSSLKFSFDLSLPGKKTPRKTPSSRKRSLGSPWPCRALLQLSPFLLQIEVMHDYQEKRNSLQYFISDSDDSLDILKGHVINELIETERVYVEELFTVLTGYRAEMDNPAMLILLPPVLRNRKDVLFGNMPEIYDFHNKIFLHSLENCLGAPERVGCCFLDRLCFSTPTLSLLDTKLDSRDKNSPSVVLAHLLPCRIGFLGVTWLWLALQREDFQMYEKYCQNKPRSESLWRQCSESSFFQVSLSLFQMVQKLLRLNSVFQECQRKLEHKLGLDSYLLKPVQRLTKYQLLLKELLKYSTSCDGVQELQEALVAMLDLLKSVNDSMHQISITGYDGDLSELGKVLMQGSFSVWTGHRKGPTKMKDLARFKPMQRHLFLYEKALVFCKKREEHGDGYDKTSSYSFKHFLKMSAVGITENVKGDHRKFEIWYSGREEVYVVQAQTVDLKMAWLNEIRKILFKQQELIKAVEKPQPGSCSEQPLPLSQLGDRKQQRASISSEENDSERTSPVMLDSGLVSPQSKPHRGWPGMSQSLEICEGLEEWSGQQYLSNCSDTEEEEGTQLSPGKYKALADCKRRGSEELLVKNGDEIQLLHEDGEGQWLVKNLNRRKEGWVPVHSLQIVVGDCRFRNAKVADFIARALGRRPGRRDGV
ncbi:hypothetical protein Nmel_012911 [Mimus melanotis]